jgi:hypothetical protein
MNARRHPQDPQHPHQAPANEKPAEEEDLEGGWFVHPVSQSVPVARPRTVPPTGDAEVDGWLK